MTRYIFSLLLLVAVILFDTLPRAEMAGQVQTTVSTCHTGQATLGGHSETEDCGTADHSMTGACATACIGSIAVLFPTPDPVRMDLRSVRHHAATSLVLHGRLIETADRPPKSI